MYDFTFIISTKYVMNIFAAQNEKKKHYVMEDKAEPVFKIRITV